MNNNPASEFAKLWSEKLSRLQRVLRKLPREVGNVALKYYLSQFKNEETPDGEKWPSRKTNGEGARTSRKGLLVKSGRLRKSIKLSNVTRHSVTIGTNVKYGRFHNTGTATIPQRQFLSKSKALNRRLQRMIKTKILWTLRK